MIYNNFSIFFHWSFDFLFIFSCLHEGYYSNVNQNFWHILLIYEVSEISTKYFVLECQNCFDRASLVAQWLRICLPMQGTRIWALVWEDPTCHGATGPVSHNYWACASGACAPQQERPRQWEACAPRWRVAPTRHNWRKPSHRNGDPTHPKINK